MRLLIVKLSSLGDVVHTLPALTDAARALPGLRADWAVESGFSAIPARHPAVDRVIPISLRKLRTDPLTRRSWLDLWNSHRALRAQSYDLILDAQGLYKSAIVSSLCRGPTAGLSRMSAREPLASLAYRHCIEVPRPLHAVERVRRLFAGALGYSYPFMPPDYGLQRHGQGDARRLIFLHGTTWQSKHYPTESWKILIALAEKHGYRVALPWGNDAEKARAEILAQAGTRSEVLPASTLDGLMEILSLAAGVISVDSGLGHLACALGRPVVGLYGATDSSRTGLYGGMGQNLQANLPCSPCLKSECPQLAKDDPSPTPICYQRLEPTTVWSQLQRQMARRTATVH